MSSIATTPSNRPLVIRSAVAYKIQYTDYLRPLRSDFFYSCAYCGIAESEATALRFTIDHYEPVSARPDLINVYANLMYCCEACNSRKGDRTPSESARNAGKRFFKVDVDVFADHFTYDNLRIKERTPTGWYTIQALELNRPELRRLRELRARLSACHEYVSGGLIALQSFPLDQLPSTIRTKVLEAINHISAMGDEIESDIDRVLKEAARSLLDTGDPTPADKAENEARLDALRKTEAMHPGVWRGRHVKRR